MHQLIQRALLSLLRNEQPESDLVLLELLISRISFKKAIHPVLNSYYFDIAHTARTMLRSLESPLLKNDTGAASEAETGSLLPESLKHLIEKQRICLRIGQDQHSSIHLSGLFSKLYLARESFELVSEILNRNLFPLITLEVFNTASSLQLRFSETTDQCEYRWLYLLRQFNLRCRYLFSAERDQDITLTTANLDTFVPPKEQRLQYFFDQVSQLYDQAKGLCERESHEPRRAKGLGWIKKYLVSEKLLNSLLKEAELSNNQDFFHRAQQLAQRIYKDLGIPAYLQSRRTHLLWQSLPDEVLDLFQVKNLISKQFYDCHSEVPFYVRPCRNGLDFYDYSRNYICKDLAESCLSLALLLPVDSRSAILEVALTSAHESERSSNATKADGDMNVVYRKQLLARCYGALGNFQASMFYHSLVLIGHREHHSRYPSRTSRDWLDDVQCRLSATLRQMQMVVRFTAGDSAVLQYLRWVRDGFGKFEDEFPDKQLLQKLRLLDPFDESFFPEQSSCDNCEKNFVGLTGARPLKDDSLRQKLISHYEIHIMLLQRRLQGGYFYSVQPQDLEFGRNFVAFELEMRQKAFDFFFVHKELDSDPSIFEACPKVYEYFWQMMSSDLIAPSKFESSDCGDDDNDDSIPEDTCSVDGLAISEISERFGRLAHKFKATLEDEQLCRRFIQRTFASTCQRYVFSMLKQSSFDKRVEIIRRMEEDHPDIKASQHMLRILFQTVDIKDRAVQALNFFADRHRWVQDSDSLGNLLRICADCCDSENLKKYWEMGLRRKTRERFSSWPDKLVTEQLNSCFSALKNPNEAWKELHRLMNPISGKNWGSKLKSKPSSPPPSSPSPPPSSPPPPSSLPLSSSLSLRSTGDHSILSPTRNFGIGEALQHHKTNLSDMHSHRDNSKQTAGASALNRAEKRALKREQHNALVAAGEKTFQRKDPEESVAAQAFEASADPER
jgi:hypothetical protein